MLLEVSLGCLDSSLPGTRVLLDEIAGQRPGFDLKDRYLQNDGRLTSRFTTTFQLLKSANVF